MDQNSNTSSAPKRAIQHSWSADRHMKSVDGTSQVPIGTNACDGNLNRHVLRPNKHYWNNCLRNLKFRFLIENPDPTFIIETWTKGISITPWPSDYNWITNQRYKVWTPQGRIPDKFTVLKEPKEEQSLTFSDFYSIILENVYKLRGLYKGSIKLDIQENIF